MIFYFTGTGNSLYAARTIADFQNEKLVSVAAELDKNQPAYMYELKDGELLGFVYPIYAWAPPKIVLDFVKSITFTGGKPFVFSLNTCGEDEGRATAVFGKALKAKGLALDCAFSLKMPSNYVIGSNVYPKAAQAKILRKADEQLQGINGLLKERQSGVFIRRPGKMPALKTALVSPLFNRFATTTKPFRATDACTACGLCERVCPLHNIQVSGKPAWGNNCVQCLACINRCPAAAIQYGKATEKRGRYVHPDL